MIAAAIGKQLGYRSILNDYFSANVRSGRAAVHLDAREVAEIPRAAFVAGGSGWQTQVIVYADLDRIPTFDELMKENERKRRRREDHPSTSKL